ncbi:PREDICTED: coiled-coil domain-containing protein R3HCC1L isoform X2 [Dinoponera quadriceps]|uniref:Coiled-coil domain-containing protein R3HCC1L isoform X2 n=1 Tax=Dinoponera quadriceps TaxID=609295 RepID=A0A6P3WTW6_DINQU|nr:PREDICTED: coiled-coil domain-containing protein R3HCC1L isoform X2 [Dinoponera quadriceps]
MSLQDSLFSEDVEDDVTTFARSKTRKSDWEPKPNAPEPKVSPPAARQVDTTRRMGVEGRRSSSTSPEHAQIQRQAKSVPAVEIYRPPAARRAYCSQMSGPHVQVQPTTDSPSVRNTRQRRPDRAVYIPRHRRSLEAEEKRPRSQKSCTNYATPNKDPNTNNNSKAQDACCIQQSIGDLNSDNKVSESHVTKIEDNRLPGDISEDVVPVDSGETFSHETRDPCIIAERTRELPEVPKEDVPILAKRMESMATSSLNESNTDLSLSEPPDKIEADDRHELETTQPTVLENQPVAERLSGNDTTSDKDERLVGRNVISDVLVISDAVEKKPKHTEQVPAILTSPEKKVKKIERPKSKPAPPPSPPLKINRDECDWDSLFDDNGDCLDPTLIEELTSAVGEVMVEQPKNDYKAYSKQVQVSSDEFAHVVEIYNFPSEFKTSDLAAVFSPFRNGGFELKWVDDTHCLGVFSSPLIAAEVLASNHPFVKTRPLSEASALSKTKARKSAEFLQPYRNRPETCAALARRLVTGALGVKLATARQEREHEKNVLREAKEKRRLANKQREDVWEGIIPGK